MTAESCSFADYDWAVTVFNGLCAELICIDGRDFFPSTVSWASTAGAEYLILVHAFALGFAGNFVLTISSNLLSNATEVVTTNTDDETRRAV